VAVPAGPPTHRDVIPSTNVIYSMDDVAADFPDGTYAFDSDTSRGTRGTPTIAPDLSDGSEDFCRDAFKPVYLHWNGPSGIVSFLLQPPQLFVSYRQGTYRSPRGLIFFRAIYETITPSEGTDADGDVWRFLGRFNALCRGGQYEIGPLVFRGQLIVTEDPITTPVFVRHSGGGAGGGGCENDTQYTYETYDPYNAGLGDNTGCGTGVSGSGTGGSGGGGSGGATNCHTEYIYIDVSTDGGLTWTTIWEGDALVCE
jgi:hypothetical protein